MIKLFRNIRKKLLEQGKTANPSYAKASAGTYLKYAIGEIVLVVINKTILCPVRDKLSVARINTKSNPRAFRYEIYYVPKGTLILNK